MAFEQLGRPENDRRVRHAAMVAAFLGLVTMVQGFVLALEGAPGAGWVVGTIGAVQLALAWGVHRRSRAAAGGVLLLFAADRAMTLAVLGPAVGVVLWTAIFAAVLLAGTRIVFAEGRASSSPGRAA